MARSPVKDGRQSTDRVANRKLALSGNTGVTSTPVPNASRPDPALATKLAVLASGTSAPGAGASAVTGQLVKR